MDGGIGEPSELWVKEALSVEVSSMTNERLSGHSPSSDSSRRAIFSLETRKEITGKITLAAPDLACIRSTPDAAEHVIALLKGRKIHRRLTSPSDRIRTRDGVDDPT